MATEPDSPPAGGHPKHLGPAALIALSFFGVGLPALTLVIELFSGLCAEMLFDPAPTAAHALLIALVPLANLAALLALRRNWTGPLRWLGWLNGIGLGIAGCYAILFLPVTPFAILFIMAGGLGFLPLAPLAAFVSALVLRARLPKLATAAAGQPARKIPGLWPGIILALAVLAILEVPKTVTSIGLQMATAEEPEIQARGLRLLRGYASRDVLLRACYVRQGLINDPLGFAITELGGRVNEEDTRRIYYRVTGAPFNAVPPPRLRSARGQRWFEDWDAGQGGDAVQGRLRGLSLQESRMDAVLDAAGAAAYLEWTMVFKNISPRQQEARAVVVLPPDGVVSRLTLWIDGEEREAAFGGRRQVREAYRQVVQARRDPVLVTTCGPDRVLVQCFPVPPGDGRMKIRLGITAPLALDTPARGLLRFPYFAEHNFNLPETVAHGVWVESRGRLEAATAGGWLAPSAADGTFALRGTFLAPTLDRATAVRVERPEDAASVWARDQRARPPQIIRQTASAVPVTPPRRVLVVIDLSRRLGTCRESLAAIVAALPTNGEFGVLLAADSVRELVPVQAATATALQSAAAKIRTLAFNYGCDNVPALARAWDLAADETESVLLWLHAAQPVDLGGLETLRQKWERRPANPLLLGVQFGPGPNVVLQGLDQLAAVRTLDRSGDPAADARQQIDLWTGQARAWRLERAPAPDTARPAGAEASFHVVRLWAQDEILRLNASRRDEDRARALDLAQTYQLVTPLSGAVVLETEQQYQAAGLEPVASQSVPTIPEPETWMLAAAVAALLVAAAILRRRTAPAGARRG